jgi:alginate O-acetyltransferase complex protein AlgI
MLFHSYEFFYVFLPIIFFLYFYLNKKYLPSRGIYLLIGGSLFFYGYWNVNYLPLILLSIFVNYVIGVSISKHNSERKSNKKLILIMGLIFNITLIACFKYLAFFVNNINYLFSTNILLLHLQLPLAISFFTFQQIAFLTDCYRGEIQDHKFKNYLLFVSFFPQLIAGPIVHYKEMVPQFTSPELKKINYKNIAFGLILFSIGLLKKIGLADELAVFANQGFSQPNNPTLIEAWITSLSFTFQIYFDFSGYIDMAMGAALLLNIQLPINFNSPYKACDIQSFWRKWHITLGRFLKEHIYIPFGGNRKGNLSLFSSLMITFLIGGLWHGASWTFVFWGFLHGIAVAINRVWQQSGLRFNKFIAWFITFNFLNIAWIFFRASSFNDAINILKGLFGFNGLLLPTAIASKVSFLNQYGASYIELGLDISAVYWILLSLATVCFMKNSTELKDKFIPMPILSLIFALFVMWVIVNKIGVANDFIYFQF